MHITMAKIGNKEYPVLTLPNRPKAILDRTLAEIYGVKTKEINQAWARNPEKFPDDFCFQLSEEEMEDIMEVVTICDHLCNIKYSYALPRAFTHLGCNMLCTILKSETAVRRCVEIIRAFTQLEETGKVKAVRMQEDAPLPISLERLYRIVMADHEVLQNMVCLMYDMEKEIRKEIASLRSENAAIALRVSRLEEKLLVHELEFGAKKKKRISSK